MNWKFKIFIIYGGVIVGFTAFVLFIFRVTNEGKDLWEVGHFWEQILINLLPSLFVSLLLVILTVLGIPTLEEQYRKFQRIQSLGSLPNFWRTGNNTKQFTIICGKEKAHIHEYEPEPRLGYAEAFGLLLVDQTINQIFDGNIQIRKEIVEEDEPFQLSWFDGHVVIFGSELSIKRFGDLSKASGMRCYQSELDRNAQPRMFQITYDGMTTPAPLQSKTENNGKKILLDYGSVVRIRRSNGQLLILLNGNYGAGLLAATFSVTRPDFFSSVNSFKEHVEAQELLVYVDNFADNFVPPGHPIKTPDLWNDWKPFNLKKEDLETAIRTVSR